MAHNHDLPGATPGSATSSEPDVLDSRPSGAARGVGPEVDTSPLLTLDDVDAFVAEMRRIGIAKLRIYPDGRVEEIILGPPPPPEVEPRERKPTLSPLEEKQAQAARIRRLALSGLGGVK